MLDELLMQINELAKKKKEVGLSEEEEQLRKELHQKYLEQFRSNFKKQLENVDVEYDDGSVVPLTDLKKDKSKS